MSIHVGLMMAVGNIGEEICKNTHMHSNDFTLLVSVGSPAHMTPSVVSVSSEKGLAGMAKLLTDPKSVIILMVQTNFKWIPRMKHSDSTNKFQMDPKNKTF